LEGLKQKVGIFIGTKNIFNPTFNYIYILPNFLRLLILLDCCIIRNNCAHIMDDFRKTFIINFYATFTSLKNTIFLFKETESYDKVI